MAFDGLDAAQKAEIQTYINANDYVGGYAKVLEFISYEDPQTGEVSPKDGVNASVWLWFRAAIHINQDIGPIADLIRGYTSLQHELRYGTPLTAEEGQALSNAVAHNVLTDVISADSLPTIDEIAENDASAAVATEFNNNRAAWSGNPLFLSFGHVQSRVASHSPRPRRSGPGR